MTTGDYSKFGTFRKPIYCPGVSALGYGKYEVSVGDFILYAEARSDGFPSCEPRFGRVLGKVVRFPDGKEAPKSRKLMVLAVLTLSDNMEHAYLRYVPVVEVREVMSRPPGAFLRFFLFGSAPSPEIARDVQNYGAMNESYIGKILRATTHSSADGGRSLVTGIPDDWRDLAYGRKKAG